MLLLFTSCKVSKKAIQNNYEVTDFEIHSIEGFSLITKDLNYGVQIVNECKTMEKREFWYHLYSECINPRGETYFVTDSLTSTSHNTNPYNIGDKMWLEVNENHMKYRNTSGDKLTGIYQLKMKYDHEGCHFNITFNQKVTY